VAALRVAHEAPLVVVFPDPFTGTLDPGTECPAPPTTSTTTAPSTPSTTTPGSTVPATPTSSGVSGTDESPVATPIEGNPDYTG
jgi:hypothetical protein